MHQSLQSVLFALLCSSFGALSVVAKPLEVGQPAPDFTIVDFGGTSHSLSAYRGKIVVMEWVNPDCPIVKKHYDRSGNIPKLQRQARNDGIVWISINSGSSGSQGDLATSQVGAWIEKHRGAPSAYIRDVKGDLGRLFGARTTPHFFIVNPEGVLVYQGAIDSIRSGDPADIDRAENYVKSALEAVKLGRMPEKSSSQPYGCAIKY